MKEEVKIEVDVYSHTDLTQGRNIIDLLAGNSYCCPVSQREGCRALGYCEIEYESDTDSELAGLKQCRAYKMTIVVRQVED